MTRWSLLLLLFRSVAGEAKTGLVFVAEGCTASSIVRYYAKTIIKMKFPKMNVTDVGEAWHKLLSTGVGAQGIRETSFFQNDTFTIAKIQPALVADYTIKDFLVRPLPFAIVGLARTTPLDYVVCSIRDNFPHGMCKFYTKLVDPTLRLSHDMECMDHIGYVVDGITGERVDGATLADFRANRKAKESHKAYLYTKHLIPLLDTVYEQFRWHMADIVNAYGGPLTILESADLLDWSTDDLRYSSAVVWQGVLSGAGLDLSITDVEDAIIHIQETSEPHPCSDYKDRIYNIDEVTNALRDHPFWGHTMDSCDKFGQQKLSLEAIDTHEFH